MEVVSKKSRGLYFVSPLVDASVIGGASIVAYAVLWAIRERVAMETIYATSSALLVLVNWPHFSATCFRLYHSRANVAQYPMTAFAVPFIILAGVWASFVEPDAVAPYFVKLYLIWSPYHFSGQTLGISLLYARRAGVRFSPRERFALAGFIYGTFLLPTMRFEAGLGSSEYYGIAFPTLSLPAWAPQLALAWLSLCGLGLLAMVVRRRALPPAIIFLPAFTQFVWFVPGSQLGAFNEFIPMFHSLQYLFIAWTLQLKERLDFDEIAPSRRYVLWESVRWLLMNRRRAFALRNVAAPVWLDTAFALFCRRPVHHFFVDGVRKLKTLSHDQRVGVWGVSGAAR